MHDHPEIDSGLDISEYDLPPTEGALIGRRRLAVDSPLLHKPQLRHFLLLNVLPTIGTLCAIAYAFWVPVRTLDIVLFAGMWLVTGLGISAGYHRLLCHQSYRAKPALRFFLTVAGSMAGQGSAISWVAMHRRHHHIADKSGDVHSPNLHGTTLSGRLRGFIHSHFTWMIRHEYPNVIHYVPDLLRERSLVRTSRLYFYWIVLGLVIPAGFGWVFGGSLASAFSGFLWGGVVRMFVVGQSISALNSVLHLVGTRRFRGMGREDNSRNNWLIGALVWGEGWHNNHHAFPYSASFALAWYKLDLSYWFIKACEGVGLASDVKTPSKERIEFRRAKRPEAWDTDKVGG
ncbi:fatty-acid desaturase (plasmid) [Candidatus Burkholderia crenata]|nr:fatty-acid desaturase [Candidatus Burkholderia crenata]